MSTGSIAGKGSARNGNANPLKQLQEKWISLFRPKLPRTRTVKSAGAVIGRQPAPGYSPGQAAGRRINAFAGGLLEAVTMAVHYNGTLRPIRLRSARIMTQTSNRLLDEMARLMNDASSVAQGVKREAEGVFRSQMERIVADLDLVKREDFDIVREMAAQAKAENEALKKRIEALEGMLGERTP
jgi:hypothetical protein